jgi:hypothetical protein
VQVGITHAPRRSTLSYANEHRPATLFEDLFWTASARFREQQPGRNSLPGRAVPAPL